METSKLFTFIGFAIKARKVKMGVNAIKTLKRAQLLILCHMASENTVKEAISLSKRLNAKLFILNDIKLEDVVFKDKLKLIAVCDDALAKAIIDSNDSRLKECLGGLL